MPHSLKREGDEKTSRQLLEWRSGGDIGIALFRRGGGGVKGVEGVECHA